MCNTINSKRWALVLTIVLLALGLAAWLGMNSPTGGESRKNDKAGNPNDSGAAQDEQNLAVYALELQRPPSSAEKAKLAEQVDWMGGLNGETLLVRAGKQQKQALVDLPYVKSLTEYRPEQKLPAELQTGRAELEKQSSTGGKTAEPVVLTITLAGDGDKPAVIQLVKRLGGRVLEGAAGEGRYLRVELPGAAVNELAGSPRVLYVEEYTRPELLNDRARDIVGARPLAIPGFVTVDGLNGAGQTIALADSGLDTGSPGNLHPDLESPPGRKPRVIMIKSWAGVETPADTVGHGTHMAGTLVGSGKASDGKYAGLAPGASLYFQGIVDKDDNPAPPLDLRELFEPAYNADARIHVNGWGKKQNTYDSAASQIDAFVREHPDFLAIFGAGNSGPRGGTLTAEANSKNALVVGASLSPRPAFENDTGSTEEIAAFSSRGPAQDGRIKPELVAPGTSIISTASRLLGGDLPGRPEYTVMQGTSMATAVTGGAAALLRQYMTENTGFEEPSAALLKAALINGAGRLDAEPEAAGFGLLDIGSTILALENRLFDLVDEPKGLATGESFTVKKNVEHSGAPFKATLAWSDPAAAPGAAPALVNNLDLEVIAPDGAKYFGNDFARRGERDVLNNVEQVYIPDPQPGTYTIVVHGRSVPEDASPERGLTQDFALVFGQMPARKPVQSSSDGKITLAGGERPALPPDTLLAVDDRLLPAGDLPPAGAELYLVGPPGQPRRAYAVGRTWRAGGVKSLAEGESMVLVRMNRDYREGGYAIEGSIENALTINGKPVDNGQAIPPGADVTANINPHTQTIWQANLASVEIKGILTNIDMTNRQLKLLDHQLVYNLAEEASVSFSDILLDGDPADLPFGASTDAGLEKLLPGMPVHIILGSDGKIYHLAVKRDMVVGQVTGVETGTDTITLSSGGRYHVMAGIKIVRDRRPVEMGNIRAGDLVMLNLIPNSTEALGITVYSDASYGRVIFAEKDTFYMMDSRKGFRYLSFSPQTQVFRWGMAAGTSILSPGQWVRVISDPVSGEVWRVDIAEAAGKVKGVLESYSPGQGIKLSDGSTYRLSSVAVVTKNGLPVRFRDLVPGEPVTVSALYGPGGEQIVAALEAETRDGVEPPLLEIRSTIPFEDFSLVTGKTGASRLYARLPGGDGQAVELTDNGEFYYPVSVGEAEAIQLVAVDGATGGVASLQLSLPRRQKGFSDIDGHWAETDIRHLVSRGMLSGYPDGTFRPDSAVTRVEFTVMLARLLGTGGAPANLPYKDADTIPHWAENAVALAYGRGLAVGYDDNTFRPLERITREEAAALLVRAWGLLRGLPEEPPEKPDYKDWQIVAAWAREDVSKSHALGLLSGRPGNLFAPGAYITRAETAAALNRLLDLLTQKTS
ncbi:S8 family serine peptidase [Desulfoscipio geothermicus]|uniref:S8 family serine peptidase n=1 Tax=Desulfoscipio geothermicus TaxID=39060 RepID=UPI0013F4C717|nr:S8 family serine peptidase [Desulfoscipio geothermicus]